MALAKSGVEFEEILEQRIARGKRIDALAHVPVVAVPTTVGTGSEVTVRFYVHACVRGDCFAWVGHWQDSALSVNLPDSTRHQHSPNSALLFLPSPSIHPPTYPLNAPTHTLQPWAAIWDMRNKQKYSVEGQSLWPEAAIIDPFLAVPCPRTVQRNAGLDALSHALVIDHFLCLPPGCLLCGDGCCVYVDSHRLTHTLPPFSIIAH